ncbi:MAG: hypothetical protein J5795_00745 [Lachnospiraceae bacterium]|nr:hypothetical protein [Lachnospiraceae bacterium]
MDYYRLESNCDELRTLLEERRRILKHLIQDLAKNKIKHPGGMIKTCNRKKAFQYYWKEKSSDPWKYLSKSNTLIAKSIANSEYRSELLRLAEHELRTIERFLSQKSPHSMEVSYQKLSKGRKALIQRFYPSDEEFLQDFLSESYEPSKKHEENLQFKTTQGELVRSKAEWMIAEKLYKNGIPYQYEFPVFLKNLGTVRPDFRCLNVRKRKIILWEHQGMMGEPDYACNAIHKMQSYEENGYYVGDNLIVTEEAADCPLLPHTIDKWIERLLL